MTKGKVEEPIPSHYHLSLEVGEHSVRLPSTSGPCCYSCSVAKSCLTLWNPMKCSTPGAPVLHCLPEFSLS